jgi:lipopolysaccharide export system permease protein
MRFEKQHSAGIIPHAEIPIPQFLMAIIDRYLLRQFFSVFCILFCSLLGLYVVADSVNNFEELSSYGKQNGGMLAVVGEYYGYRSFAFFDQSSPLLILIAAMFTVAAFRRHNEMTALVAAGVSKARVVRPIIFATIGLALLAVANRELLLPSIRENLGFNAQDLVKEQAFQPMYDNGTDILIGGHSVQRHEKQIVKPNFFLPRTLDHYGRQLVAERALFLPADQQHAGGYLLDKLVQPKSLDESDSLALGDKPVIITPKDADWLDAGQCFVVSGVQFDQLAAGRAWRNFASTAELISSLKSPSLQQSSNVQVEIHSRFVQPMLDITLLFLGLPIVLTRHPRSLFVSVGFCVVLVAGFMIAVLGCHQLGSNATIPAAMAAWCPLMIFVPIAVGMSDPLRE